MNMSEFYRTDFKGTFNEREETSAIPASNITISNGPALKYVYVIVGIYAVIVTIILTIIIAIVINKLRDSFCPHKKKNSTYGAISREEGHDVQENCPHRQIGELSSVVDVFERSIESEYDNVSLDQETSEPAMLSRLSDVPPEYEHPPEYKILEPV